MNNLNMPKNLFAMAKDEYGMVDIIFHPVGYDNKEEFMNLLNDMFILAKRYNIQENISTNLNKVNGITLRLQKRELWIAEQGRKDSNLKAFLYEVISMCCKIDSNGLLTETGTCYAKVAYEESLMGYDIDKNGDIIREFEYGEGG